MNLDQEQQVAVDNGEGFSLVVAGAGTGKTTVLTSRINHLCKNGADPSRIMLCTFTNKAAKEMMSRIENPEWADKLIGGTFHSIAANYLFRFHGVLETKFSGIIDQNDSLRLFKAVIKETGIEANSAELMKIYSYERNTCVPVEMSDELRNIILGYEERKHINEVFDFDDLLCNLYDLLTLGDYVVDDVDHVLVDEFQDCNILQVNILKELTRKCKRLFAVGDDCQSIYSFRGAYPKVLQEFGKHFKPFNIYMLTQNYRSQPRVLDFGNKVIMKSKVQIQKVLKANKPDGPAVQLLQSPDLGIEADQILRLVSGQENVAVLFRARFLCHKIETRLMQEGIPYIVRGGLRFFEQAHIKDLVSVIAVLANYKNFPAWCRLFELVPGVGPTTSGKLATFIVNLETQDEIRSIKAPAKLDEYFNMLQSFIELEAEVRESLNWYCEKFYFEYLRKTYDNAVDREKDIEFLLDMAKQFSGYKEFLRVAMLDEESYGDTDETAPVILSTIHSAKGLEWDRVIISGISDDFFPNKRAVQERLHDEEMRLFYVAITRARNELYLSQVGGSMMLEDLGMYNEEE